MSRLITSLESEDKPVDEDTRASRSLRRRDLLARMLAVGTASGLWTAATAQQVVQAKEQSGSGAGRWRSRHARALSAAADTIVPRSRLPGAVQAGVPYVIETLVQHWMTEDERETFIAGLEHLDSLAQASRKRAFAACTRKQRDELMQALRSEQPYQGKAISLAGRLLDPRLPFYLRLRDLVMFCYFNSEAGATQATRYIPVPGHYQGDVAMKAWPYQMVL